MPIDRQIAGIVLAGGYSRRMGDFKPLLPLGGATVLERAVRCLIDGGISDVRVVVGWRAAELVPILDRLGVKTIYNPRYESGMYSSVVAAINSLGPEIEAFLFLPGDYPLVSPRTVQELTRSYLKSDAKVVYPRCDGRRGHPPLITTICVRNLPPDDLPGGLKTVLSRYAEWARDVDVQDKGILLDVDTPEDYQKALAYLSQLSDSFNDIEPGLLGC